MRIFTKNLCAFAVIMSAAIPMSADDYTDVIFSSDFGEWDQPDPTAWVFENKNANYGWRYGERGYAPQDGPYALFVPGPTLPCDDWLISPSINLEAGSYKLVFKAGSYGIVGTHTFNVCLGKSQKDTSTFTQNLYSANNLPIGIDGGSKWEEFSAEFTVAESGDYYLGFQGIGANLEYKLCLDDVEVLGQNSPATTVNPVSDLAAVYSSGKMTVSWTAPNTMADGTPIDAAALSYIVRQSLNGDVTTVAENLKATSYEVNITSDGSYSYTVVPVIDGKQGKPATSNVVKVELPVPEAVTGLKAANDDLKVTLTWVAPAKMNDGSAINDSALTYKILQSLNGGDPTFVISGVKECSYEYSVTSYGKYVFTVIPMVNGKDGASAVSSPIDIVNIVVDPVGNLTAVYEGNTILVSWTAPEKLSDGTSIDASDVTYILTKTFNGIPETVSENYTETEYKLENAPEGVYDFSVIPVYGGKKGESSYSGEVTVKYPAPEAVKDAVQSVEEDKVTLSWSAPSCLDNGEEIDASQLVYKVNQIFTPENGVAETTTLVSDLKDTSYEIVLSETGTYVFSVVAVYEGREGATFDFEPVAHTLGAVSAIEEMTEEAIYYTLQGVRTDNPEKGLYIRLKSGKAEKIYK